MRGYNHSKNLDDEVLPEQPITDDHQNGLSNKHDEKDWGQDRDNPVWVPAGASERADGCSIVPIADKQLESSPISLH